jgi:DNA-binding response OmpR family regulator
MPRALVVEDDPVVQAALVHALRAQGHETHAVATAAAALRETTDRELDIVVLDLGLPDLDGVIALEMLREVSDVPVIVATARGDEGSVVRSLNAGADDYIVKPFSGTHLAARINALLRRSRSPLRQQEAPTVIDFGDLRIDLGTRQVVLDGKVLDLTRREFDMLTYLAQRPGQVISRRELFEVVWDNASASDDRTIDVHTSWLRRKLGETAARPRYLRTIRGVGYRFALPG